MGIFQSNKVKDELVLVFDLGSSSVGGALFWARESGIPKIIFSFREPIILEKSIDTVRLLSLIIKSLDIVAGKIHKAGLGAPSKIFCVLSSPWYVSQTRVIKLEKNTPFMFTVKLADSLIEKEIALFKEEHFKKYLNTPNALRLIELKNIKIALNGYETSNPLDQKAKELEMTIFVSMSPEQVLKSIEKTIRKHFNLEEIKFFSSSLSSFVVVRETHANQNNFFLIDIGGEITEISMAKKNVLRESISFPLGVNFIIRGAASALKSSLDEARSLISLFKDGHAFSSVAMKLTPIISKLKMEWLRGFQESLANISNDISVPATIYLAVDQDFSGFFSEIIENEQFNQYTLTESKFKVIFLSASIFHAQANFEDEVIRDPSLIIDAIYINRFFK